MLMVYAELSLSGPTVAPGPTYKSERCKERFYPRMHSDQPSSTDDQYFVSEMY